MEIGEKIKKLREAKGIKLSELAKRSGVSKGHLSQLENGRTSNPSINIISALCQVLEISSECLLSSSEDSPETLLRRESLNKVLKDMKDILSPQIAEALRQMAINGDGPIASNDWKQLILLNSRLSSIKKNPKQLI